MYAILLSALVVASVLLIVGLITPEYFERIKVVASVLTPLVILLLGLEVNHALEKSKAQLAKEKDWKGEWAKRFYAQAISFNGAIEDAVMALQFMMQENNQKLLGWEKRAEDLRVSLHEVVQRIQKTEWSLIMMCEFCPNSKDEVLSAAKLAFNQTSELLKNKQGNLEEIRKTLHSFNIAAMKAHSEILGLS
ncbi:MAG: hypothetical protein ACYC1F_07040 [Gallionellaceae bacterium]